MTLSFEETEKLIDQVLESSESTALRLLTEELESLARSMPEFYEGVIKHGPRMRYTSDQWLDFHRKVPHWRLQDEKALMDKLSPHQRESLPVAPRFTKRHRRKGF